MAISFTTGPSSTRKERMFVPLGATSVSGLPGFDEIKIEDLEVGTKFGAPSSAERTSIDPQTLTYLHGEEAVLAELKKKKV